MAKAMGTDTHRDGKDRRQCALLLEMETVAVQGRRIVYDVLKGLLAERGADLTEALFSRHCLHLSAAHYLPDLLAALDKKRLSAEKLAMEIGDGVKRALSRRGIATVPDVAQIVSKAKEEGAALGALTSFGEETGGQLLARLQLGEVKLLTAQSAGSDFPTADMWLKLAKSTGVPRIRCTVLASSQKACKTALSAGMRCVVIPDEFTRFQDFGGADFVVENFSPKTLDEVISILVA